MEILSVSLKNFKSHRDRCFTFQPGTNAICGENGAGKTSILEAIAWALFNYRGSYKNEDLIYNGANSAQVSVTFVSNRDQRTYEINRCTRAGYTIYDPQLGQKLEYNRIEDEVLPWLRQHFGVAAGTDLGDLFANTIGVPQGLFTADFLKPDKERKKTFDTILKVEEYRRAFEGLLSLNKYAEAAVKDLEREIASYDEALESWGPLVQQQQEQSQAIEQVKLDLQQLQLQFAQLQAEQAELSSQATQIQQVQAQLAALNEQIQAQTQMVGQAQQALQQANDAAAICIENRDAHLAYVQAETELQELQQKWLTEQALQQEKRQLEQQMSDRNTQLATLVSQLDRLAEAKREIEQLQPRVQQQLELEQAQQALNQQLQHCLSWSKTAKDQEKRLTQHQVRARQLSQEIAQIRALETSVQTIPALEQQQQRYQQQLSRIAAAAQFEADLRQLWQQAQGQGGRYLSQVQQTEAIVRDLQRTVPLWVEPLEQVLTTLHTGMEGQQQLLTALEEILADLSEQTAVARLEQQLQGVEGQLRSARQHQVAFANLEALLGQQAQLDSDIEELQASLEALQTHLAMVPDLQQQQAILAQRLEALQDPKGRIRLRQEELRQEATLHAQIQTIRASFAQTEQAIANLNTQLATFANLGEELRSHQAIKDQHRAAHEAYWAYRELANTRRQRREQLQSVTEQLQALEQTLEQVSNQHEQLRQHFDPERFQAVQATYQQVNDQSIALTARLPDMLKYLENLDQQLSKLQTLQEKRALAQAELTQKRKIDRFVKFARKAYKEAGPRITERYVQSVSREADKLFRELLNRPNVGLEWTRDYEILVQEGAHTRRFINLSGGEQMCAALAVRLALLKVLADIDIAFFDEPTTNMDRPRRESLAEAIANIKTFRQLFVISHDDTFEKITENIIQVEREG